MSSIIKNEDFSVVKMPEGGKDWWFSGWVSDARLGDIFRPAEAGMYHFISRIFLISAASPNLLITVYAGDKILIGPIPMNQYGGQFDFNLPDTEGIPALASAPLIVKANNAVSFAVLGRGRTV